MLKEFLKKFNNSRTTSATRRIKIALNSLKSPLLEARIRQRVVQSLHSGEKRERASWTKSGISLILLTCRIDIYSPFCPLSFSQIPIKSVAPKVLLALLSSNPGTKLKLKFHQDRSITDR